MVKPIRLLQVIQALDGLSFPGAGQAGMQHRGRMAMIALTTSNFSISVTPFCDGRGGIPDRFD